MGLSIGKLPLRPPEECKVLIVDDDERIIEVLSDILKQDGYQILTAREGFEALKIVSTQDPDVVVLDVRLPGIDGIEVCRQIKQDEQTQFLPVILVTGNAARRSKLEGLQASADDFLNKPIDPLELTARIRSSLRNKQLTDAVEAQNHVLERRVAERTRELQKAYEQLQQLSRIKGNILAIVSHELRTPLHQAKQALYLSKRVPEDRQEELLETVHRCFKLLEYRIGNIDAFSDPTALNLEAVAVSVLLNSAYDQATSLQNKPEVDINLDIPKGLPAVLTDTQSMTRALAHLIDNAIKFGEGKPVYISALADVGGVRISIVDSGKGIAPDLLPRIFEPLMAGDISSKRRQGGMGIGLALVKMILDAHNVELELESKPNKGTRASFVLPLANL